MRTSTRYREQWSDPLRTSRARATSRELGSLKVRHYVLTRSAYGPAWDVDANRRRLEMTRAVTVAGMAAQTNHDWQWLVALDRRDPLRTERRAVFESAGVPVAFLDVESSADRSRAAFEAYGADWNALIGERFEPVAMTRLDDDDAFAPWALERIATVASRSSGRWALMLPHGVRVWNGRYAIVRHRSNAMQTLVTPAGDELHVYAYGHRKVLQVARVRTVDARPGWLWSRHPDTISGWHIADRALTDHIRSLFPIDWSVFGAAEGRARLAVAAPAGRYFR